jgi:hypothetical protein
MSKAFIDPKQAEEFYEAWKAKHPEEAAEWEAKWEAMRKDPLQFKKFMEEMGFHFNLTDEEFVKQSLQRQASRWNRLKAWWKKKPTPQQRAKNNRGLAVFYAGIGCFSVVVALAFMVWNANIYQATSVPTVLPSLEWYSAISFLVLINFISGSFLAVAAFWFFWAFYYYARNLSIRIKELEKKVEAHGMREV